MGKSHDSRQPAGVKQWKHELELLRSQIGRQHDHVIERMPDDETRLVAALYSFAETLAKRVKSPPTG